MNNTLTLSRDRSELDNSSAHQAWLLSFTDLIILLLTMFVMRVSMSSFGADGNSLVENITGSRNFGTELAEIESNENTVVREANQAIYLGLAQALSEPLGSPVVQDQNLGLTVFSDFIEVKVTAQNQTLIIARGLFEPGSAIPSFRGAELIQTIAKSISGKDIALHVTAHTDNLNSSGDMFATAWELTRAQARVVSRQIIDTASSIRVISTSGYAHLKPEIMPYSGQKKSDNVRIEIFVSPL